MKTITCTLPSDDGYDTSSVRSSKPNSVSMEDGESSSEHGSEDFYKELAEISETSSEIDQKEFQQLEGKQFSRKSDNVFPLSFNHSLQHADENNVYIKSCLCGGLLSILLYIRPDALLFVGLLSLATVNLKHMFNILRCRRFYCLLGGAAGGLLVAICNDLLFFGDIILSPLNWVQFNVISGFSSTLFGESQWSFYMEEVFFKTWAVAALTSVCLIFTATVCFSQIIHIIYLTYVQLYYFIYRSNCSPHLLDNIKQFTQFAKTYRLKRYGFAILLLVMIYSCFGHKECRFLHDILILMLILASGISISIIKRVSTNSVVNERAIITIFFIAFCYNQFTSFENRGSKHESNMIENLASNQHEVDSNKCLHHMSMQKDVTGLFLERKIMATASYSILHQNIPTVFITTKEFVEYHPSRLVDTHRSCYLCSDWPKSHAKYHSINSCADVIDQSNARYLLKKIIDSPHYNYAIVSVKKSFFYPGFVKVLTTPTVALWRRTYDREAEARMMEVSAEIPQFGANVTGIEYQGEVLKLIGNYKAAVVRFQTVLKRGHLSSRVYASLAFCLHRDGDHKGMSRVLRACYKQYDKDSCNAGGRAYVLDR